MTIRPRRRTGCRRAAWCALPLVGLLGLGIAAAAAPPLRLGLWEVQTTTTLASAIPLQVPRAQAEQMRRLGIPVPGQPSSRTNQTCLTAQSFDRLGMPANEKSCHRENVHLDSHGLSADIVCDGGAISGHGRVQLVFDDDTHVHGTGTLKGSASAAPGITGADVSLQGHWLAAQCGAVKPLQ